MPFSFYLDIRNNNKPPYRIIARYTFGKDDQYRFPASNHAGVTLRINKEDWNPRKRRAKYKDDLNHSLIRVNQNLDRIEKRADEIYKEIVLKRGAVPYVSIFRELWEKKNRDSDFFESIADFLKSKSRQQIKDTTLYGYRAAFDLLRSYQDNNTMLTFSDMDQLFIDRFVNYCEDHSSIKGSTVDHYIKRYKTFLEWSLKREHHSNIKFKSWDIPKRLTRKESKKKHLEKLEMFKIEFLKLSGTEEKVRDIFIFLCNSGMRIDEYLRLDKSSIQKNGTIKYLKGKQPDPNNISAWNAITITPWMMEFIRKYSSLPKFSYQHINNYLKVIAAKAGIDINLTTHVGRYTFINMSLNERIDINKVGPTVGHSDISTTNKHYKRVVQIQSGPTLLYEKIQKDREEYIKRMG